MVAGPDVGRSDGDGDTDKLSDLQIIYNSYLAIAANVPNAVFVILTAFFGHRFNTKVRREKKGDFVFCD